MEYRDLVSVSRTVFAGLGLEGFRSRDFECCKEMVVRINQDMSEKCQKFEKNKSEVMTTFFKKISAKSTNFQVSSLGLEGYGLDYITALYCSLEHHQQTHWQVWVLLSPVPCIGKLRRLATCEERGTQDQGQ